jgi:hypothetical protein
MNGRRVADQVGYGNCVDDLQRAEPDADHAQPDPQRGHRVAFGRTHHFVVTATSALIPIV